MLFSEKRLKVLLCDGDSQNGMMMKEYLRLKNCDINFYSDAVTGYYGILKSYDVDSCIDASKYSSLLKKRRFDLVILDLDTLKEQGNDTIYKFREAVEKHVPFLYFLKNEDLTMGNLGPILKPGIDDFMVKPINLVDLAFRVEFVCERNRKRLTEKIEQQKAVRRSVFEFKDIVFNYNERTLFIAGEETRLKAKECEFMALLCSNLNRPISRRDIIKEVWYADIDNKSLDSIIYRFRRLLAPTIEIVNIHGRGYKLNLIE